MRHLICIIGTLLAVLALSRGAHAQAGEATPAATPWAQSAVCAPQCRSGYLCMRGECVSACNPPCAPGEQCRGGECFVQGPPPPPPPPFPPPPPPPGYAGYAPAIVDPGIERHDGFMLRLTLGFGYASTRVSLANSPGEVTISGANVSFSFDIGGAITENLILHLRIADIAIIDPTVSLNGDRFGQADDSTLRGAMFGPALTYYFMPSNVYLTVALGFSWLTSETELDDSSSTDVGFGANVDVGKEWWVSDNWGLGLVARLWLTHLNDSAGSSEVTYNLFAFTVGFSGTYN